MRALVHILSKLPFRIYRPLAGIAPKLFASVFFRQKFHRDLNWEHPSDINEKINWLKFYGDTSQWPLLADKYRVRQYVKQCGLEDLLVPLYGVWQRAEDIDWDSLPEQFVMKPNNGSGKILICRDKSTLDTTRWTKKFHQLLKVKLGNVLAEPHYNKISPCIVAEQLLDNTKQDVTSASLLDYKIWAFNGQPAYIVVYYDRKPGQVTVDVYDCNWKGHPEYIVPSAHFHKGDHTIPRPAVLDKLLQAASRLSAGHPQIRADFYLVDGRPYFGELTLTASAGFNESYTSEFKEILGAKTSLPNKTH